MSKSPDRESIDRPLAALRGAGTVFGVLFYNGLELIFNETPFSTERVSDLGQTLDDIAFYFTNEGRDIDQMSFGFDGGNMLIITDQDYRVVVMHSLNDEVDFISKACRAFLIDYQMGIFATELNDKGAEQAEEIASGLTPKEDFPEEDQAVINVAPITSAEKAEEEKAMTGPIQPIVSPTPVPVPVPAASEEPEKKPSVPSFAQPVPPEKPKVRPIIEPDKNAPDTSRPSEDELKKMAEAKSRAVLSTKQPESTLPPPRKPKIRR